MDDDFFGKSNDTNEIDLIIQNKLDDIVNTIDFTAPIIKQFQQTQKKQKNKKKIAINRPSIAIFIIDSFSLNSEILKARLLKELNKLQLDASFAFAFLINNEIYVMDKIFKIYTHNTDLVLDTVSLFITNFVGESKSITNAQYGILMQKLLDTFNMGYPAFQDSTIVPINICFYERSLNNY